MTQLLMKDVEEATGTNGMTAVSTFAGCGGSSTGHRLAGFKMLWASEFVDHAANSYAANKADYTKLDRRDIREVTSSDILNSIGLDVGELDLFDGSPPCSAFSTAGKRAEGWGQAKSYSTGKNQVVDDLFFEYARLVKEIQPRAFIAENVTGLVKGTAKGYFKLIYRELVEAGYKVNAYIIDAHHSGVAQQRQRLIFIGARNDLGITPTPPPRLNPPLRISDITPYAIGAGNGKLGLEKNPKSGFMRGVRPASQPIGTLGSGIPFPNSNSPSCYLITDRARDPYAIDLIDPETNFSLDLGDSETSRRFRARAHRAFGDNPLCRLPALKELREFSGFPIDFTLTGNYHNRLERLGRAVPPQMMAHISKHVRDTILNPQS